MEVTLTNDQEILCFADIPTEEVNWLWYPYIPYGKITILQGDPGCGKTMVALSLAAMLSTGAALPFSPQANEPITILYQTSEDGIADTIKPRLERAQADCTRIKIIDESKTPLRFDDTRLEAAVRQENARLLILDPLSAYIGESVSMNQANEVRSAFRSLNKMNGTSALYRTSGSIDVAGAVRSILTVTKYRKSPTQRVLVPVKSNLAPAGNGLLLEVTDHVEWLDQLEEADADQLLNGNQGPAAPTKQQQAEQGLLQLLQNGPMSHKEITLHFSRQGISKRTVELAKSNLPIKSIRIKDGWLWQLEEQP